MANAYHVEVVLNVGDDGTEKPVTATRAYAKALSKAKARRAQQLRRNNSLHGLSVRIEGSSLQRQSSRLTCDQSCDESNAPNMLPSGGGGGSPPPLSLRLSRAKSFSKLLASNGAEIAARAGQLASSPMKKVRERVGAV